MKDVFSELCTCTNDKLDTFCFLRTEDVEKLSNFFKCKNVSTGKTLWEEGDRCDYVAFIVSGRVEVKKKSGLKGNQVILGIYSKGDFVGELCILDNSPRAVTAVALDDVSLLFITQENFDKLINTYPALGSKLMKGMLLAVSKRLRSSFGRLIALF